MGAYHRYDWRDGTVSVYCDELGCENWTETGVPEQQVNNVLDCHDSWHGNDGLGIVPDDDVYEDEVSVCEDCAGEGKTSGFWRRDCKTCQGSGLVIYA